MKRTGPDVLQNMHKPVLMSDRLWCKRITTIVFFSAAPVGDTSAFCLSEADIAVLSVVAATERYAHVVVLAIDKDLRIAVDGEVAAEGDLDLVWSVKWVLSVVRQDDVLVSNVHDRIFTPITVVGEIVGDPVTDK